MTYRLRISRDRGDGGSPITAVRPVRNGVALPDIPVTQPIGYPLELALPTVQDGDQVSYRWVNAQGASGPLPTALIAQRSLTETTVAFEVTSSIASIAFALDDINPPASGTWTYAYVPPFAGGEGFTLAGNVFTIFPAAGVPSGTYRIRRTRSDGAFQEILFVMTAIPAQITFAPGSGVATMTVGANDPATQTYALRPTTEPPGGPWDGQSIPISRAALDAVVGTSPQRAAFFGEPAIGFQTDADSDGQVDQGDVIRIVRGPITSPASVPITSEWEIDGVLTGNTDPTYTRGAGVSGNSIRRAWTDGFTTVRSNALPLAAASLPLGFVQAWNNSGPSNGTQRIIASGVTIPAGRYLMGAVYRISGGVPTWATSPFSFAGAPLSMLAAHFDGTNANAALLELASSTTGDLVANAMSNSTNWRGIELMLVRIGSMTLAAHQRAGNSRPASAAPPPDFGSNGTGFAMIIPAGGGLVQFAGRNGPAVDAPAEGFLQNSTRVHSRTTATDDLIGVVAGFDTGLPSGSRGLGVAYVNPTTQALRANAFFAVPLNP